MLIMQKILTAMMEILGKIWLNSTLTGTIWAQLYVHFAYWIFSATKQS